MALGHCTRILIVEDDALLALMMEEMVEDLGYWVVGPYRNLNDAVEHAREDEIDFGLLDFNLDNGTDSLPVIEALTKRGVPFAITTGADERMVRRSVPDALIISKPVVESELERVLP